MTRAADPELVSELPAITTALIAEKGAAAVTMREVATAFFGWSLANPHGFALVFLG